MRLLILCTHNSARSQMGDGWARYHAQQHGLEVEVWSAGTEATTVKPEAVSVMAERGIDLSTHSSKTLYDLPDPWHLDYDITVCDSAASNCPVYPAQTTRLHYPFTDPSGGDLEMWRHARDEIGAQLEAFIFALKTARLLPEPSI
ncbi:MAG: arsenate reductase ArsC [Pleurocapsa sp. SU_196_0]|nr:arsenate reductase ArsC [Pleurocapsa sp. SU_196_0]